MNLFLSSILGLAFGSFANVYFYRIPMAVSLWKPSSRCPNCNHPIQWFDNIPILSYFILRGSCRYCKNRISLHYPFVEFISLLLFTLIALKFNGALRHQIIMLQAFGFILFLCAGIDLITYFKSQREYGIIPDHLTFLLIFSGLIFSFQNPMFKIGWQESLFGGIGAFLFAFMVRYLGEKTFKKEALGFGDVKLLAGMGLWIGLKGALYTVIFGSLLGTLLSLYLITSKKLDRQSAIPYGPFLVAGAYCVLFTL